MLSCAKPPSPVVTSASLLNSDYILKTNILDLYADYQKSSEPKAIMSISFALIRTKDNAVLLNEKISSAIRSMNKVSCETDKKNVLLNFADQIMNRNK